jgi:hypothetical protein
MGRQLPYELAYHWIAFAERRHGDRLRLSAERLRWRLDLPHGRRRLGDSDIGSGSAPEHDV